MTRSATAGWLGLVAALALGALSCSRTQNQGPDPASANMAPADQSGQGAEPQAAAIPAQEAQQHQPPLESQSGGEEQQVSEAPQPPPPLPEYSQPPCPGDNYLWTPGYWGYSPAGYYWVPGAWVMAPYVGALWTPPWWGYSGSAYLWHAGYWGPYVGFYGGINYGFGYTGLGFSGGYWRSGVFDYNRSALNVDAGVVHNVYERSVVNYTPFNRISYNGVRGGIDVRPNASQEAAFRERRLQALPAQTQLRHDAASNRAQFAAVNRGRPAVAVAAGPIGNRYPGRAPETAPSVRSPQPMSGRAEERRPLTVMPETRTPMNPQPQAHTPMNARPEARTPMNATRTPMNATPQARVPMNAKPEGRTQMNARPEMRTPANAPPENRVPNNRPEAARPAPAARPQPERQARPAPEGHTPQQQARPAPESHKPSGNEREKHPQ
jgi:hypothetical protein